MVGNFNPILIINDKIITLLKILTLRRKEKRREAKSYYFTKGKSLPTIFPSFQNDLFEIKNESKIIMIIKEIKKIKNDNNKIKKNQIQKIKNNINEKNIIIRNYLIINLIKFIIIDIFLKIKNNILLDLFHFHNSKIELKIKGIGDSIIFGNERYCNFTGINYLKEVYINGNKKNTVLDI